MDHFASEFASVFFKFRLMLMNDAFPILLVYVSSGEGWESRIEAFFLAWKRNFILHGRHCYIKSTGDFVYD